jgi:hypothetical protein
VVVLVVVVVLVSSGVGGGLELTFIRKGTPLILRISLFSFCSLKFLRHLTADS